MLMLRKQQLKRGKKIQILKNGSHYIRSDVDAYFSYDHQKESNRNYKDKNAIVKLYHEKV